jgi:Cu+-exporting ATPase
MFKEKIKRKNNMFRRRFLQSMTWAGANVFPAIRTVRASESRIVSYRIKGFTCIACAVGLETMLRQQKGVSRAEASYPKANVLIEFDAAVVTDKSLKEYIAEMGFRVEEEHGD